MPPAVNVYKKEICIIDQDSQLGQSKTILCPGREAGGMWVRGGGCREYCHSWKTQGCSVVLATKSSFDSLGWSLQKARWILECPQYSLKYLACGYWFNRFIFLYPNQERDFLVQSRDDRADNHRDHIQDSSQAPAKASLFQIENANDFRPLNEPWSPLFSSPIFT